MTKLTVEYLYGQSKGAAVSSLDEHLQGWSPEDVVDSDPLPIGPAHVLAAVLDALDHPPDSGTLPALWHWIHFLRWARHCALRQESHALCT